MDDNATPANDLDGVLASDALLDRGATDEQLAPLFSSLRAPASAAELSSADATLAQMVSTIAPQIHLNVSPLPVRPAPATRAAWKRVSRKMALVAVGMSVLMTGVAGAATGSLPGSLQDQVGGLLEGIGLEMPTSDDQPTVADEGPGRDGPSEGTPASEGAPASEGSLEQAPTGDAPTEATIEGCDDAENHGAWVSDQVGTAHDADGAVADVAKGAAQSDCGKPERPSEPATPAEPGGRGDPATHADPAVPATPATPATPNGAGVPATPATPATRALPAVPNSSGDGGGNEDENSNENSNENESGDEQ